MSADTLNFSGLKNEPSLFWNRYEDAVNSLSQEQKEWVSSQKEVIGKKTQMYSAFIEYLFEKEKDAFVYSGGQHIATEYVKAVEEACGNYVSETARLRKENDELKARLDKIEKELKNAESKTTVRGRRSGEACADENIRASENPRENCFDFALPENQPQ